MSDTRFTLPAVDDPASTEVGIILLGLDAERLLAGAGLAWLGDDPALITLAVDQLRHDAPVAESLDGLVESGIRRWHQVRATLAAAAPVSQTGSLRVMWERTQAMLAAELPGLSPASTAYLTACWLRRDDVDRRAEQPQLDGAD